MSSKFVECSYTMLALLNCPVLVMQYQGNCGESREK